MDVVACVRDCLAQLFAEVKGIKALLLDEHTVRVVSLAYPQSEILQHDVFLTHRIDTPASGERLPDVSALCFLRPSRASLDALIAELRRPRYNAYYIYLCNTLDPTDLELLAGADEHSVVREVKEVHADFLAMDPTLFSCGVLGCSRWQLRGPPADTLVRTSEVIFAVLKALRLNPTIRFQRSSEPCQALAERLDRAFGPRSPGSPCLLLLLDRRDDPLTPLTHQWTYQAMAHDLLGMDYNRVRIPPDDTAAELVSARDDFFAEHMFATYGELLPSLARLTQQYKDSREEQASLKRDVKRFFENYAKYKAIMETGERHMLVIHELRRLVDAHHLLTDGGLCEVEVEMLTKSASHSASLKALEGVMGQRSIPVEHKARLALVYLLRFEKSRGCSLSAVLEMLRRAGAPQSLTSAVDGIYTYCGEKVAARSSDVMGLAACGLLKPKAEMESLLTQHTPLLATTLDRLAAGKLSTTDYPATASASDAASMSHKKAIVFIVGGATYEEAKTAAFFNECHRDMQVVLGGTEIVNFRTFCEEMQ